MRIYSRVAVMKRMRSNLLSPFGTAGPALLAALKKQPPRWFPRQSKTEGEGIPERVLARSRLPRRKADPKTLFRHEATFHDQGVSLTSQWTPHWRTSVAGYFYQWAGTDAGKFVASLTGKLSRWGAFTAGGAAARDKGVIPKGEAFFDYDHGWRLGESGVVRALEIVYEQHWYWYTTTRILTINGTTLFYLPHEWTWSLGLIGARSHFSGTGAEWRPSGVTKLGFPMARWDESRLSGNVFFAAGTENFAQLNQIGQFSSQTYGGGLRFQFAARQDVSGFAAYQERTQDRSQASFGFTYGIRF